MSRIFCLVSSNFLLTVSRRCSRRSFSTFRQEQCDSSSETYNSRATRVNEKKNALRVTGILFGILSHYATPSTKTHFKYMKNHIISSIPNIYGLINDPHNDFLPVGLIAELVEHCTSIAEVRVRIPVQA